MVCKSGSLLTGAESGSLLDALRDKQMADGQHSCLLGFLNSDMGAYVADLELDG